MIYFSTLLK